MRFIKAYKTLIGGIMTYRQTLKNIFDFLQKSDLTKILLYLCLIIFLIAQGGCSFMDDGIDQTEHILIVDTTGNQLTDDNSYPTLL